MIILKSFNLSQMGVNTHILNVDDDIILIDAPANINVVIDYLEKNNLKPNKLLLTHYHFDHILGLDELKEKYPNLIIYINKDELKDMFDPEYTLAQNYGITYHKRHEVKPLDELEINGLRIETISGHSPNSSVFIFDEKDAFVGDTLFKESIGRTDLLFGDQNNLINGIKKHLLILDDDTNIYPGHGEKTTIKAEKQNNLFLK